MAGGTGRCIQCIQTSAVLQGGQAPARPTAAQTSSLEHEHPLRTCSHCTKSCGNRGHTYTPHSRRALREARNRRAQHAGRRTTTRKRPSVHQKNAARRVTNAQALGISLIFTLKRKLCHPCTDAAFLRRRRRPRHEEHVQTQRRAGAPGLRHAPHVRRLPAGRRVFVAFPQAERHAAARRDAGHERRITAGPRQTRAALRSSD